MKETRVVNISEVAVEPILKKNWTVIIPAAGRGTRLGFDQPKILFVAPAVLKMICIHYGLEFAVAAKPQFIL